MDNLAPRILDLVTRLSGQDEPRLAPSPALGLAALERAYREALQRWWEPIAQGPSADRDEVARVHQEILRLIDEVGESRAAPTKP